MAWPEVHDGVWHDSLSSTNYESYTEESHWAQLGISYGKSAQTFQPSIKKQISAIDLKLSKTGSPDGYVWVEIWNTSGDLPTSKVIDSAVSGKIRTSDIASQGSGGGVYKFYLPKGITLEANTRYAIVVIIGNYTIYDGSNFITWRHKDPGNYSNGRACHYDSSWSEFTGRDFFFTTYYGETNAIILDQLIQGAGELPPNNIPATTTPTANKIPIADANGKLDVGWLPATSTPTANKIPIADANGKLNVGYIPAHTSGKHTISSGNIETTSTVWVETGFSVTIVTGATALVTFVGSCSNYMVNSGIYFDISINGALVGYTTYGLLQITQLAGSLGYDNNCSFSVLVTELTAGSNTFKLEWKVYSYTGRIAAANTRAPTLSVIAL
jgi:hypothetical protein